jgi:hypothetical protein
MNRFIPVLIGLVIAVAGQASAGSIFKVGRPPSESGSIGSGEIRADGSIKRGSGFTSRRVGFGQYEITFENGYFPGGCAAMTVGSAGTQGWHPFIASVTQHGCGTFNITLWYPNQQSTTDHRFQFVAISEQ